MKTLFKKYPKIMLVAVNVILIFILLFLAEAFLSFTKEKPKVEIENDGIHRAISLREGRPYFSAQFTPEDYWKDITDNLEFKTYHTRFDENGFLEPSKVYDQPDKEIFFLGGSTTFCEFVDENARFPTLTARLISEKTSLKINGYNGGMSFNNSLHSINTLLNKVIPQSPDIVVMMHATNDAFTLATYESYFKPGSRNVANLIELPQPPAGLRSVAKGFRDLLFPNLYSAVQKSFAKAGHAAASTDLIEEKNLGSKFKGEDFYVEKFEQNLRIFISICQDAGIEPVLMTQANRLTENPDPAVKNYIGFLQGLGQSAHSDDTGHYLPLNYAQFARLEHAFNEAMRRVGAGRNVLVIDLEKNIPQTKEFIYDAVHFTEAGSRKAAEIIAASLTPLLTASRPAGELSVHQAGAEN